MIVISSIIPIEYYMMGKLKTTKSLQILSFQIQRNFYAVYKKAWLKLARNIL